MLFLDNLTVCATALQRTVEVATLAAGGINYNFLGLCKNKQMKEIAAWVGGHSVYAPDKRFSEPCFCSSTLRHTVVKSSEEGAHREAANSS